jgi:PAS domain S-box-containing protein
MLAIVLAAVTLAACVCAGFNLAAEFGYEVPTDGITWVEVAPDNPSGPGLCAHQVAPDSAGKQAGLRPGDILTAIDDVPTPREAPFVRELFRVGSWGTATYQIVRPAQPCVFSARAARFSQQVYLRPTDDTVNLGLRLIAVVYLLIGIYVLLRRWTAPKSTHFFVFCLVSFVLYAFKYTGQLDTFDEVIYWANLVATSLQPALFLHFAFTFTGNTSHNDPASTRRRLLRSLPLYLPGLYLVGLQVFAVLRWSATAALKHRLDKVTLGYMAIYYVWAAAIFYVRAGRTQSPLERQQLKWLTRGTLLAVVPFTLLYVVPYLTDYAVPSSFANVVRLSLVFLPLTFSWAIVRYRLMDVDLIFKRGVTYTLATAALVGLYFGVVALAGAFVHQNLPNLKVWGLVAAVAAAGLLFDPLKRAIQARVDRVFDQKRFDYRETLVDFGRSLNSQTDLRALTDSIVERLPQTLLVSRVAVFLAAEQDGEIRPRRGPSFEIAAQHGLHNLDSTEALDLRFLDFDGADAKPHVFLENPQQALRLSESERATAARLDLNYFLPCRVANRTGPGTRTVAIIGLGRTHDGDFLSSEDMEVLESLAGYIGIAIQNAQLYRRLESKINEFERLKDFNQNIVESINIGIFAVDLEDRIESWNAQMEVLFARPRAEALRHPLAEILPPEFIERFHAVRGDGSAHGTHTLYKFRLALPTGETRIANISIAPLLTRTFDVVGRIILVDDITAQMQLEAQLSQSEKLSSIGLLAAGVAHEVNTPLAVISSYTQMLTKQLRADPALASRLDPVLQKITQQTFRASEIVNGLLNFSRTSGSEFIRIDLNQLLRESTILLDHQFKTARVQVEQHLSHALPPVNGNQGKLQQVLLNLMLNAKDAMNSAGNGGTLTLRTFADGSDAIIEIADTGGGIAPDHLHRIFDPFFTTKTNPQPGQHKGTGLGLAVSYGILQEHGGKIKVESEVGQGTTFRLEIPVAAVPVGQPVGAA